MKKKNLSKILFSVAFLAVGVIAGWFWGSHTISDKSTSDETPYMRLTGYKYISPLLLCDNNEQKNSRSLSDLESKILKEINQKKLEGKLTDASVFIRDINSGNQININPDVKYFPASLTKIPFMIAFLKAAESQPDLLNKEAKVTLSQDYNASQEVSPKESAKIGQSYKADDMLSMMVKYSDNNSLYTLVKLLDQKTFNTVYEDLGLKFPSNVEEQVDYMTAYDFAYFLRILYNSTYLKRDLSEKALGLMSASDFDLGIKAGLPSEVNLAHKFGLQTKVNGSTTERQMHDCGIVYDKDHPYVICMMTRSTASIEEIESTMKEISSMTYEEMNQ